MLNKNAGNAGIESVRLEILNLPEYIRTNAQFNIVIRKRISVYLVNQIIHYPFEVCSNLTLFLNYFIKITYGNYYMYRKRYFPYILVLKQNSKALVMSP